jgi:hypothetical protein
LHLHLRVDLPDGSYTHASEGGDEGTSEELQHVFAAQGLDQSPKGSKETLPAKESPRSLTPSLKKIYAITFAMIVHLRFRS